MPAPALSPSFTAAIDGLRGVAILAILIEHCWMFGPGRGLPWYSLGAHGVDLLFVLSGFCLSFSMLRRHAAGRATGFNLRHYFRARLRRIVLPYFAALALFGALALTPFGVPGLSTITPAFWHEWLGNFFFIINYRPAINQPLWALGVELRWYALFPLLFALYLRSRVAFFALLLVCYICEYTGVTRFDDIGMLPCFMLGIVAADLVVRGVQLPPWVPYATALLLATAAWPQLHARTVDHLGWVWHVAAFATLLSGLQFGRRLLAARPLVYVGLASYSIFLTNFPFVAGLESMGVNRLLAGCIALAFGFLAWRFVEIPASVFASRLLGVAPPHAALTQPARDLRPLQARGGR